MSRQPIRKPLMPYLGKRCLAGRAFAALFRAGALVEVLREAVLREAVFERDFAIGLVLFLRDQNYGPKRRGRLLKADADGECNADAITPIAAYRFPERAHRRSV